MELVMTLLAQADKIKEHLSAGPIIGQMMGQDRPAFTASLANVVASLEYLVTARRPFWRLEVGVIPLPPLRGLARLSSLKRGG